MNRTSSELEQQGDHSLSQTTSVVEAADPVQRAALERQRARAQFDIELQRASAAGESAVRQAWSDTRPAVLGLAMLGGAVATIALVAAVRTFRRRPPVATLVIRHVGSDPPKRSTWRVLAQTVAFAVGRKLLATVLERLNERAVAERR